MAGLFLTGFQAVGTDQPSAPTIPSVPQWDGSSAGLQNVLNQITQALNQLTGNRPQPPVPSGPGSNQNQQQKQNQLGRFTEVGRNTQKVTVKDPESGATLTYVQITSLTMKDTVTQELWTWSL
jgi:hypothetical protein